MPLLTARLAAALCLLGSPLAASAQADRIELPRARFATGDDPARSQPDFDDSGWKELSTLANYEDQGFEGYDGWSWYRFHVVIPASLKQHARWRKRLSVYLSSIDDVDETWFNGAKIGKTGHFPDDSGGYDTQWAARRTYQVDLAAGLIRWDHDNVIAVRVYDGGGGGGFFRDMPYLRMTEIVDGVSLDRSGIRYRYAPDGVTATLPLANSFPVALRGRLQYAVHDAAAGATVLRRSLPLTLPANGAADITVTAPARAGIEIRYRYVETTTGASSADVVAMPYFLTPPDSPRPRINGPRILGVRPGSPVLFRIPATGTAPLAFSAGKLPDGLSLDSATGVIRGSIPAAGDYSLALQVTNALGTAARTLTIRVGETIALTPPMGWNSWNAYGLTVDASKVRASADALLESGLAAHGWNYVNIDDGWEAEERAPTGEILTNAKFPDLKSLSGYLHTRGLRFGIYSSPGPRTCGGFLGSYEHERQDAERYAEWGVDYLKYDLCSYMRLMTKQPTLEEHQRPYLLMNDALRAQPRDIVYSLCQYGLMDVWSWGPVVGGNSWRTTGDIEDEWKSVRDIANAQDVAAPYAKPGHWNDPDMLVVGVVGWGGTPHPSRLTPDEQYSHITLWSLLAAPLLLGNDLTQLDPFTLNLLTNDEVLAVDQDPLGTAARRVLNRDDWEVWIRPLADGRKAIGIFNLGAEFRTLTIDPAELGLEPGAPLRDLWRQQAAGRLQAGYSARVPAHGVLLLAAGLASSEH